MSKELECLNKIQHDFGQLKGQELVDCYEIIFNGLKRLEAIDNAKPSEALECLNKIVESFNETTTGMYGLGEVVVANDLIYSFKKELDTIKQALQRLEKIDKCGLYIFDNSPEGKQAEKLEKAWDIVNNKEVNMIRFKAVVMLNGNANDYNKSEEYKERHLTDEEFELIKEMMK